MLTSTPPALSVVIPCLNEARHLPQVLAALAAQTWPNFEVIVVDGGSTDDTVAIACAWAAAHPRPPLRVITNPHRHIPHALNLGIAAAQGDIIVRMDGHAYPEADYLAQCVQALAESGAELVGGAWDIRPGAPTATAQAIALAVSSPLGAGDAAYRLGRQAAHAAETVPFGCFHRSVWRRLGGYNEALLTNEDYEFASRIRQAGGRIWFTPLIRSRYQSRATLRELAQQYWRYGWWKAQMLKRHPHTLRWRQAVPILWAGLPPLLGLAALAWPPLAWLAGGAWLAYLGVLIGVSARLARSRWPLWPPLMAAFVIIHFAWGWGVWASWARQSWRPLGRQA